MTRLNRLHPYPAMVADELASKLAALYAPAGAKVLDPFCGSGRLLAAARHAGVRAGLDTNPLAWLLTSAKLSDVDPCAMRAIADEVKVAKSVAGPGARLAFRERRVEWFSDSVLWELGRLVGWINHLGLPRSERLMVAAVLSATVRDVSFARQQGWKLHRLSESDRASSPTCPWGNFARRLGNCAEQVREDGPLQGVRSIHLGRIGDLDDVLHPLRARGSYDLVITSPPYGDSRTTVQYGAASALLLAVVGHLNGLEHLISTGSAIDARCLGGPASGHDASYVNLRPYWAGAKDTRYARSVGRFLADYVGACRTIAANVRPGGKAVMIVGRRSTGGFRLRLDDFTRDCLEDFGFKLLKRGERKLFGKAVPRMINRFGGSKCDATRSKGCVKTIDSEVILVFEKSTVAHL